MTTTEPPTISRLMHNALIVLREDGGWLTPNQIGFTLVARRQLKPGRSGHNGKVAGPGSCISPTIRALQRRGFLDWGPRPDGLSGTAYRITDEGRRFLRG